jgi:phosphomannomutase
MVISSISGIRGVFNVDLRPADASTYAGNFARMVEASEFLLGTDTRPTGEAIKRAVKSAVLNAGANFVDYGVISTPALFRESRRLQKPGAIITASHNEPEWNGLKFLINGRGINQAELDAVLAQGRKGMKKEEPGKPRHAPIPAYNGELIQRGGEGSCQGVKVVLDLNGSAAIRHAPAILRAVGCDVMEFGGTEGNFTRTIDPTSDPLEMLTTLVKKREADVGFAFDCDGDRLVVVDHSGKKRTGDYMLTLALKEMLPKQADRSVVVSIDTTQAVDEIVTELGGKVYRSAVGEANVISLMIEKGVALGGEGSSGGLVDSTYNYCRDSMLAAITIVGAIENRGVKVFDQVKSYSQARLKFPMSRKKALGAIKRMQKEYKEAETIDGLRVRVSPKSWVLIRPSNTEEVVRVSSEAPSGKEAEDLAQSFLTKVKRLGA